MSEKSYEESLAERRKYGQMIAWDIMEFEQSLQLLSAEEQKTKNR